MTSAVADAEETTQELEGLVAGKLRERGLLGRVYTTFSGAGRQIDLTLAATITEFHGVSPLARRTGEFFVGRAVVGAQVILQDARTGEVLGSAAIRGESSGGSVFAGTTDQAIDRAADEIVRFVTGSRR